MVAVVTEPGRVPPGWTPFATSEVGSFIEGMCQCRHHDIIMPCFGADNRPASAQEAALEADRYERGDGLPQKGVAGSGRPRYCRKCQVNSYMQAVWLLHGVLVGWRA